MKLKNIVQGLLLAGLASSMLAAHAQQRIEITGSSIKRLADESALPVQTFTAEELQQSGITSASQLIESLSANADGVNNPVSSNTVFGPDQDRLTGGGSFANLRGLGPTGTLVLLNGRRLSPHGTSGASVDLSAIPWAVLSKVEILRDGASAIYGTDAIGGVINFILKKEVNRFTLEASFTQPFADGGGDARRASLSGGYGSLEKQGFNIFGSVILDKIDILRGIDRDWATGFQPSRGLSPDTTSSPHANIIAAANTALGTAGTVVGATDPVRYTNLNLLAIRNQCDQQPFGAAMAPNITLWDRFSYTNANSRYRCVTDYGRQFMLIPPREGINAVARANFRFGQSHEAFVEFTGSKHKINGELTPFQFSTTSNATTHYPVNGPHYLNMQQLVGATQFNPTLPIAYRMRMWDWGYRTYEYQSENQRFAVGADGDIGRFSYKVGLSHSKARAESYMIDGYADTGKLAAALATGIINPFLLPGQEQTQQAKDLIASTKVQGLLSFGETSVTQFDATLSGELMKLPGGTLDFAIGTDIRQESYLFSGTPFFTCVSNFSAANIALPNSVMGCAGNSTSPERSRDIKAVFAELMIPVTKNLIVQAAVRHDEYETVGGTTNPKLAFRFTPAKEVLVRGSAGTGFRAPTPQQLYLGTVELNLTGQFNDPVKCANPQAPIDPTQCARVSLPYRQGGNPTLKPETSKQYTFGLAVQPMPSLTLQADWWKVRMDDRIRQLSPAFMITNYPLFQNNFIRDANGNVTYIQAGWVNAAESITEGIDFSVDHNTNLLGGRLRTKLVATKMLSHQERLIETAPLQEFVGRWSNTTLYLPWKGTLSFNFKRDTWDATLTVNYRSSYDDENRSAYTVNPPFDRKVASYTTASLVASWKGIKNLTLTGGIINLFDRDPPFTWHNVDNVIGAGWDPRVADPRGRTFAFTAKYEF